MAYKVGRCLLRQKLKDAGMTQLQLANKLGVTEQQINKYVNNRQGMSLQVAKNIAVILNCHTDDLYEWVIVGENE
ncbi:XRE family transcriptional regulator [Oceanobacillus arenosus]|uniref:XRE family transcriptional regulator n=1 Tax=Oceanobacillus arenosus TaxID=1229153 RepID=A0A3D8PPX9_9BACI|nr:helix-turn-helix transcriptional regulator [Oceanobacillus arenosus]RDW17597.1 XRE family transcriptional regulator [Oceanobacillus arenosus]